MKARWLYLWLLLHVINHCISIRIIAPSPFGIGGELLPASNL